MVESVHAKFNKTFNALFSIRILHASVLIDIILRIKAIGAVDNEVNKIRRVNISISMLHIGMDRSIHHSMLTWLAQSKMLMNRVVNIW